MTEYSKGSLIIEKPKNAEFGDFAVNISSLARNAKMAPPIIANVIVEYLNPNNKYTVTVVGGFINFKINETILSDVIEEILLKKENYSLTLCQNLKKIPFLARNNSNSLPKSRKNSNFGTK